MERIRRSIASILFVLFVFPSFQSMSYAENTPKSITFQKFDWLDNYKNVKKVCDNIDGIRKVWLLETEEKATIDTWDNEYENVGSDIAVPEGGVILRYSAIPVAGYTASLKLSFIYPIVDGLIQYDTQSSQFYKAQYSIEDIEDVEGAYNDLKGKLTSLYGSPSDKSYSNWLYGCDSPLGALWTAEDGSLVWLCMYYNVWEEKYDTLRLVYSAPNTNEMLIQLASQIKQETYNMEESSRNDNASNLGGL